jgi:hypothetical protein
MEFTTQSLPFWPCRFEFAMHGVPEASLFRVRVLSYRWDAMSKTKIFENVAPLETQILSLTFVIQYGDRALEEAEISVYTVKSGRRTVVLDGAGDRALYRVLRFICEAPIEMNVMSFSFRFAPASRYRGKVRSEISSALGSSSDDAPQNS